MLYGLTILFTLAFVFYQRAQFEDSFRKRNISWKVWAIVMKGILVGGCYWMQKHPAPWQDYVLSIAIMTLLFELFINIIALGKGPFFVGSSSATDNKLKKYKWLAMIIFLAIAIFIKAYIK